MNDEVASPKISVVIPVYKVEKYLHDCVESVLAQSFEDFELILVDDGSSDKSGEICDEVAKRDSRILVFHKENGGVTSARRLGVEQASGEWINFVDADDLLPPDALENLIDEATDDVDWVQGMLYFFKDGEIPNAEARAGGVTSFDMVSIVENMLTYHPGPFAKIVRKKLFSPNVLKIPRDIRLGEDILMNFRLITNGPQKPKEINKVVYYYRRGLASASCSYLATEKYVLRVSKLFLAELGKLPVENRRPVEYALSQYLCRVVSWSLVGHGLPIKFPKMLTTLMQYGARSKPRLLFVYLCLKFNCQGIAHFVARIFCFLRGEKLDARVKTLLE